jgi:DNA topoisomerase-1
MGAQRASAGEASRIATSAEALRYVTDAQPGICRRRAGSGFTYRGPNDERITDSAVLDRISRLHVPPAWTDVWICADERGHIQATGRDKRGRKQYRYHDAWRAQRDRCKFDSMVEFGEILPRVRAEVEAELRRRTLDRRLVTALVVGLLDRTLVRVGSPQYRRRNDSFGLTTLEDRHVEVDRRGLRMRFRGKSGKEHDIKVEDRRFARLVRRCQELPGQELFQYLDEDGRQHVLDSADVNDYLAEITGGDFTSKDFRTWGGTAATVAALEELGPAKEREAERNVVAAVKQAASALGNTPAVCRRSYIHPLVIESYLDGSFERRWSEAAHCDLKCEGLEPEELRLLALLQSFSASEQELTAGA